MSAYLWSPRSNAAASTPAYVDVLAADLLEQQHPALWIATSEDGI
jgi:hypothetical protein